MTGYPQKSPLQRYQEKSLVTGSPDKSHVQRYQEKSLVTGYPNKSHVQSYQEKSSRDRLSSEVSCTEISKKIFLYRRCGCVAVTVEHNRVSQALPSAAGCDSWFQGSAAVEVCTLLVCTGLRWTEVHCCWTNHLSQGNNVEHSIRWLMKWENNSKFNQNLNFHN